MVLVISHHRRHTPGPPGRERGASTILLAIVLMSLLVVSAFAIDLGFSRQQARHVQGNVDAAALAAAQELPIWATVPTAAEDLARARDVAMRLMAQNQAADGSHPDPPSCGDASACTRTVGDATVVVESPYPLYGSGTAHQYVRVRACVMSPIFFGRAAGQEEEREVCRTAVARRRQQSAAYGTGLMALEPEACKAMSFSGNSETDLVVSGQAGAIIVNSACPTDALDGGGAAWEVEAGEILIVGGYSITPCSVTGCLNGTTPKNVPDPFLDPFADVVEPPRPTQVGRCSGGVCTPGYYASGLRIMNGNNTFQPGLFWIDGELTIRGGTQTATAPGVTFFVNTGDVDLNGNAVLKLPPPASGPYAGISVFQSRSNTEELKVNGTSGSSIGTIYAPSAHLVIKGNAGPGDAPFVTGSVVTKTVEITGNGTVTIYVPDEVSAAVSEPDLGLER